MFQASTRPPEPEPNKVTVCYGQKNNSEKAPPETERLETQSHEGLEIRCFFLVQIGDFSCSSH